MKPKPIKCFFKLRKRLRKDMFINRLRQIHVSLYQLHLLEE